MSTRNKYSKIVILLWVTVIFAVAGISLLFVNKFQTQEINNSPTSTQTIRPPDPTITASHLPLTPTPLPEKPTSVPPSSTPENDQPQVIGTSVAGRPLEVFQFGNGPEEKMIVAGIHGGYEWNTIVLADE